jgi:hypothetical protein
MDIKALIAGITSGRNNNTDLNKLGAHGGSKYFGVAAATGLNLTSFYVRENTTITVLSGKTSAGATWDAFTDMGVSGITLLAGDLFIAPSGYRITTMTLTLGSVIGYS